MWEQPSVETQEWFFLTQDEAFVLSQWPRMAPTCTNTMKNAHTKFSQSQPAATQILADLTMALIMLHGDQYTLSSFAEIVADTRGGRSSYKNPKWERSGKSKSISQVCRPQLRSHWWRRSHCSVQWSIQTRQWCSCMDYWRKNFGKLYPRFDDSTRQSRRPQFLPQHSGRYIWHTTNVKDLVWQDQQQRITRDSLWQKIGSKMAKKDKAFQLICGPCRSTGHLLQPGMTAPGRNTLHPHKKTPG